MSKNPWKLILCFFVWMALTSAGLALPGESVNVGDEAPDFELSDATGAIHKLSDFRGKSAVVLEFFRSGDWWPYCKKQLGELQGALGEIEGAGAVVLAISKYDAAETARWIEKNGWTFPVLSDGAEVIERYGLTNPSVSRPEHQGIPHPATIIVDNGGTVRFVNVWEDYRKRTSPETIVEELKKLR